MVTVLADKKEQLEKMKKEDSRIVKGRFFCHEPKGGNVKFSYRKYKGDPIKSYTLFDGKDYELPVGVAKHINNCGWNVHAHCVDANGNPSVNVGSRVRRFSFQSMDFLQ